MTKRILYCTTVVNTINSFLLPHIKMLQNKGITVDVAANSNNLKLNAENCIFYDLPFQRNPFSFKNLTAANELLRIAEENQYDLIHFHTPVASAFGRYVLRKIRRSGTKIIYTAHGFHFFKGASLQAWLLFYPIEKLMAYYTDLLLTINNEDFQQAQKMAFKKAVLLPGVGLDLSWTPQYSSGEFRRRLNICDKDIILLSVGEININKNHASVIKILHKLGPGVKYCICGRGKNEKNLRKLAKAEGVENQLILTGFRDDVREFYHIADLFVFPSHREGLSVSVMEAMCAKLPVVASNIRGNRDLIIDGQGGHLVAPDNKQEMLWAINNALANKERFGQFNHQRVQIYSLPYVLAKLEQIYVDLLDRY